MIKNGNIKRITNTKGVTITSLTIYVIVATVIVAVLAFLNANFFAKINDITDRSSIISESTKFKSAFIKDIKADGGVSVVEYSDNMIRLSNDTKYEIKVFREDDGNKEYAVYRNKAIIAKNIVDGEGGLEPYFGYDIKKNVVKVYLEFSDGKNNYTENGTYLVGRAISENVKKESVSVRTMIVASPASLDTTDVTKKITVTLALKDLSESDTINSFKYGWSREVGVEPESYQAVTLSGTGERRTAEVGMNTRKGTSYLWVQVEINGQIITQCLGTYLLRSNTTLVYAGSESSETSPFLGSTAFVRNQIESVTLVNDLGNHKVTDSNCWDVSADGSETYLAWYELNTETGLYKVTIGGDGSVIASTNSQNLFGYLTNTNEINGLNNLDTSLVGNMFGMFANGKSLRKLDLNSFDTSQVTTMQSMFIWCNNLEEIYLENFNTSNVSNMSSMFQECSNLKYLDVSKFDTSNVKYFNHMFFSCKKLENIDVSKFDTSNAKWLNYMFCVCDNLKELDVSNFDTSNVTDMKSMFSNCEKLKYVDVSGFDTKNVTSFSGLFCNCYELENLDVSNFDTSNVTDMYAMFLGCEKVTTLDVSKFDTSNVTSMGFMFKNCDKITELDLSNFNTNKVISMAYMFTDCNLLQKIYVKAYDPITEKGWTIDNVTSSSSMFEFSQSLVGGAGTTYSSAHTDASYAHIDEPGNPGYFTQK